MAANNNNNTRHCKGRNLIVSTYQGDTLVQFKKCDKSQDKSSLWVGDEQNKVIETSKSWNRRHCRVLVGWQQQQKSLY